MALSSNRTVALKKTSNKLQKCSGYHYKYSFKVGCNGTRMNSISGYHQTRQQILSSNCHRSSKLVSLINVGTYISLFFVLMNSQIFSATAANPLGIKGVQEGFYVILSIWAFISILSQIKTKGRIYKTDFFVFFIVALLSIYGSLMAKLLYDQPLVWGVLEERRIFALWIYFPLITALRRNWLNVNQLENMVIAVAVLCALLMVGVYAGVVPAINVLNHSEISLRGERYGTGQVFVTVAILLLLARQQISTLRSQVPTIIFLLAVLLIVVQSRQVILSLFIAIIFLIRPRKAILITGISVISVSFSLYLIPQAIEIIDLYVHLFLTAASDEYLTESWRGLSIAVVIDAVNSGSIYGNGSLSPLWNDGFARIHGPFFFLADIGVIGTLYRYGLVGVIAYVFYILLQARLLLNIDDNHKRVLYVSVFIMVIVVVPVAAPLEYRGFVAGFLLAMTSFLSSRKYQTTPRTKRNERILHVS